MQHEVSRYTQLFFIKYSIIFEAFEITKAIGPKLTLGTVYTHQGNVTNGIEVRSEAIIQQYTETCAHCNSTELTVCELREINN
jgi:hypothetical protein